MECSSRCGEVAYCITSKRKTAGRTGRCDAWKTLTARGSRGPTKLEDNLRQQSDYDNGK